MKTVFPTLLLLCGFASLAASNSPQETLEQPELVTEAVQEINLALDAYFALFDKQDLALFVEAVEHAARGRLLLEQYLGEDVDNRSFEFARGDRFRGSLALIAGYAKRFSGEEAKEMWRRDYGEDAFPKAKQKLAEWDVIVQGFQRVYLRQA